MKSLIMKTSIACMLVTTACRHNSSKEDNFDWTVDRFADVEILRYKVLGFEELTLNQKQLIYWLTQAALSGRDILWDQNGLYNLDIRDLIENVYSNYKGDKSNPEFQALETYMKQIWMGNGIYHHYSMDKFQPKFSETFLVEEINQLPDELKPKNSEVLLNVIFNPETLPKKVNQESGADLIKTSATNLYGPGVTQKEVEDYFAKIKNPNDTTPISYGLNSRVVKLENGEIAEETYKIGGLYSNAIEQIVANLNNAKEFAENESQKEVIEKLIEYYQTGDLKKFDEYSILWLDETDGQVDFINGFIESYGDPLGMTGSWESIVNFKNNEASHRTEILSSNAQWFEDNSPTDPRFKKPVVKGVTAKVINAAILAGDSYPATPIGINLPNADWIRANHGSKSVTIENITSAYDEASHGNGFNDEFVIDQETKELLDKYLFITDNLHTDLHECLGHGSGQLLPGVDPDAMKAHGSTLEETRADIFALYYLADPKLVELGLLDNKDAYKAEYYKYLLNGLMTQLMRIEPGKDIEEAHMRNRKLISEWVLEKGKPGNVVELIKKDGKTYLKINDYEALRDLFGQLLTEIQRIKSEGDYEACNELVEKYAVKVDPELHKEILERYEGLNIAPYKGFVNPVYSLVTDKDGKVIDVTVDYNEDYVNQNLRYSKQYRTLK
ncbi:MAG: dihydrofolate reductase [Muribaculaceae bacterium]|nr:dihydrofolate reductase [Muribaculaceae bacterium]